MINTPKSFQSIYVSHLDPGCITLKSQSCSSRFHLAIRAFKSRFSNVWVIALQSEITTNGTSCRYIRNTQRVNDCQGRELKTVIFGFDRCDTSAEIEDRVHFIICLPLQQNCSKFLRAHVAMQLQYRILDRIVEDLVSLALSSSKTCLSKSSNLNVVFCFSKLCSGYVIVENP